MLPIVTHPGTNLVLRDANGTPVFVRRQTKRTQKAPFNLPSGYDFYTGSSSQSPLQNYVGGVSNHADAPYPVPGYMVTRAANQAYERLKERLYASAALGVDFAEARQSYAMIAKVATSLRASYAAVKKLNFEAAARELGRDFIPKGVSKHKSAANNWLMYHFGISPLIGSVYDALEVLQNPLKRIQPTSGVGRDLETRLLTSRNPSSSVWSYENIRLEVVARQGATVRAIHNGPVHTLEQLGLINPATVLWERVPFSFVVDWFGNVGDVLSSYSDFAGMTLERTYTSVLQRSSVVAVKYPRPGYVTSLSPLSYKTTNVTFTRQLGLTLPEFSVKRLRPPSKTRAVTAISLLVQFLRR